MQDAEKYAEAHHLDETTTMDETESHHSEDHYMPDKGHDQIPVLVLNVFLDNISILISEETLGPIFAVTARDLRVVC